MFNSATTGKYLCVLYHKPAVLHKRPTLHLLAKAYREITGGKIKKMNKIEHSRGDSKKSFESNLDTLRSHKAFSDCFIKAAAIEDFEQKLAMLAGLLAAAYKGGRSPEELYLMRSAIWKTEEAIGEAYKERLE